VDLYYISTPIDLFLVIDESMHEPMILGGKSESSVVKS
jgi:hypothetical protein